MFRERCTRVAWTPGLLVVALIGAQVSAIGQFVAYNDHAPGGGTSPNATTWDIFGNAPGSSGPLKDSKTGATLGASLAITITDSGIVGAGAQGSPAEGTPLFNAFNGFVDFQGTPNPSIELTPGGVLTYSFSGLNRDKRYTFMGSAVRGNAPYTDRWTLVEIAGAASFTSAHTTNVLTTEDVALISPNQAAFNSGVNNTPETGDMVVWENIEPGPDGTFEVTCQQYVGPVPGGTSEGSKGYGITGIRLEEFDTRPAPVVILFSPQSRTVQEGQPVLFSVVATGSPAPTFQWFKNDVAIPGATNSIYELAAAPFSDDGAKFKAVAMNVTGGVTNTATSTEATLSVVGDMTAPTLVDAQALGLGQVKVVFSERILRSTATNLANYAITSGSGPATIESATLDAAQTSVFLNVSSLLENVVYTLTVSGIKDLSGSGNTIAANTQRTFLAATYAPLDIGAPPPPRPGGVVGAPGGYDVSGGGADIAGPRDQFHFGHQRKTGDFDIQARVADLGITDAYVKAGLMARESLTNSSRFAAVFASSAQLGCFFESRINPGANATLTGPNPKFPANYPWAWLRLRREGNQFTGFGSLDGQAWQQLGSVAVTMPAEIFFGMAVTSGDTNAVATAKFRDLGPVESEASFVYTPKRESLGPSNRRTGLIFSEVMYHAKERADGKVLDFVEIYNGGAIFADLTGWRISGGIDFAFPADFKLPAGAFVVIAADPAAVEAVYGIRGVLGPYLKNLSNDEDTLRLRNQAGAVRAEFTYSSRPPWPVSPDGGGHSLVCLRPSYGEEDVRAWGASQLAGGSPGFDDPILANPWEGMVINEFLAAPDTTQTGFIELYNASNAAVDLSGCYLTDRVGKFVIAEGTQIAARGLISFTWAELGFALPSAGGRILLVSADESRVLDVIRCSGQERGVSVGRAPDGSPWFRRLATATKGAPNAERRQEKVVINELMYNPITGDADDEYVELQNLSNAAVDLSGWRFEDGINFTFPAGSSIGPNGYLVVARNRERLLANYAQLNLSNTAGDFSGELSDGGEQVALAKPGVNPGEFVVVSEVTYGTGGRWPELADGGGSSLELRDGRADLAFAPNWGASDETEKSTWKTYEVTGTMSLANQSYPANKLFIMCHDKGEYLFDDLEVIRSGTTANLVSNPGFESGTTGWTFYGTHRNSALQNSGAATGARCLLVAGSETGDEGPNSARGLLTASIPANATVTIRAKARWRSGWPEVLLRVRGNGIELPLIFDLPKNLGTPGLANSRRIANLGPAITEVTHYPAIPSAGGSVLVTARVSDPDGLNQVQMIYRIDPTSTTTAATMRDDGAAGDALAGDGIYSAILPGRASGVAAFRVLAQDAAGAPISSVFPEDAPTRECLVRWGDPVPFGSLGQYHLWSTAASSSDLTGRPGQDRSYRDITVVYDIRTIYNAGIRNKGSPFHSGSGSYSTKFHNDDLFLGNDKHVLRATGNGGSEATQMAVDMSYWIAEKMGLPFNHSRYVRVYRNGTQHYPVDYDMEVPDRSIARDWFGGGGLDDTLYKIAGWFEYDDGNNNGTGSLIWATAQKKPSNAPPFKTAAYRFNWQAHAGGRTANDYSLIFNIIEAANASDKITGLMNLADMENWMRTFAHRRVIGDWDHWSFSTGQNMYMYAPLGERARLFPWDMDFVLGLGQGTSDGLFTAGQDGVVGSLFVVPMYRRMMMRGYQDAVNGPLQKAVSDEQFNARRSMLVKNGISASPPTSLQGYVAGRRTFIDNQIRSSANTAFVLTTADFTTESPVATINGLAPIGVATIEVNGVPYPVTWTGTTSWRISAPLGAETNVLVIVGRDLRGNIHPGAIREVTITYTGAVPKPEEWVGINEIMYNAFEPDAEFVEIHNSHPTYSFDLSGFKLKGADFTFPPGAFIQPNAYLLVVKDSASFAAVYGATVPIIGEYQGALQNDGETLALVRPGATPAEDFVIDETHYESVFPWPATANGSGPSLQRIDPAQDGWRAGNWGVTAANDPNRATPGRANINRANLDPFPSLWVNEIVANNQAGAIDSAGEREPWIELHNSGSTEVDLTLCYLSNDPRSLAKWQFPFGTKVPPGGFLVIVADGEPLESTASELHTNFEISAEGGVIVLSRLQLGAAAPVDYVYYPAAGVDQSFGSIFDGDPGTRRVLFLPTPGAPNNPGELLVPVSINEWMSSNTRVIADPADNDFDDWFELFNRGGTTVDLTGYFLSDDATNWTKFRVPAGYTIGPGGFLLVWADEETGQNSTNRIDLHANFKLAKEGDTIYLFTPNGAVVDSIQFTAQADNASAGRFPDGSPTFLAFGTPTPRAPNVAPAGTRFTAILLDGPRVMIGWRSTAGKRYRLEFKRDLNLPEWTPIEGEITAAGANSSISLDIDPASNRYFRVVQLN